MLITVGRNFPKISTLGTATSASNVAPSSNSQLVGGSLLNRCSSPHSEPEEDVFYGCAGADEDGYDADDHLLSDVSSETLAINSSSPVPKNDVTDEQHSHQQHEFGVVTGRSRDSNAYIASSGTWVLVISFRESVFITLIIAAKL